MMVMIMIMKMTMIINKIYFINNHIIILKFGNVVKYSITKFILGYNIACENRI